MSRSSTLFMNALLIFDMRDLSRALFSSTTPFSVALLLPVTPRSVVSFKKYRLHNNHTNLTLALEFFKPYILIGRILTT